MTREARRSYRISALSIEAINFVLSLLGDRIDELEGRRGTPKFKSNVDMGANRITGVGSAEADSDAISLVGATAVAGEVASATVNTALSPAQNWVSYRRVVDENGTIIHGFNAL